MLEARTVLSTLTVLNNLDHGAGSLRDTMATASSGDSIVFDPSVHNITLSTGQLAVAKSLNIDGPGANQLTISGNNASRVFAVSSGTAVTIKDLTIANGSAATGGGVDNAGKLTLISCILTNNQSIGGQGGGAVHNAVGGSLTVKSSALLSNTANAGVVSDVFGGGLLNEGSASVSSSTFIGNKAVGGAGAVYVGSQGGAIDNFGQAMLTVNNSTFVGNQAIGAAGPNFGVGGAIENNDGFGFPFATPGSSAIISNSTFEANVATGGHASSANGGALDNEGSGTTMSLSNCLLTGNRSIGGDGGDGVTTLSQGLGGAILNAFGTLSVTNCTLSGNQAIGGNHSTPTALNPLTGAGQGGAILNGVGGIAIITNSTLSGNQARGGGTDAGPGGSGVGGAISNSDTFPEFTGSSTLKVSNCTITHNLALAGPGGPGANSVPAGIGAGGGVDISFFTSTATIVNSTISDNQAIGSAGGAGGNGGTGLGGGISVGLNFVLGFGDTSSLTLIDCTLSGNLAEGAQGGSGAIGGDGLGGGLAIVAPGASATVSDSTITDNRALGGAGGAGGSAGHGIGGGVYNLGSFSVDLATIIKHNHASTSNDDIFP
jgi:hypothetical protein